MADAGRVETVDIGLSGGKHILVDLPMDTATLYYQFPNGRRKELGTGPITTFIRILQERNEGSDV